MVIILLYDAFKISAAPVALQNDLYTFIVPEKPFLAFHIDASSISS